MQNGPHGPVFHEFLTRREGFEPSVRLHVRLISSQVHSTTLPPLRSAEAAIVAGNLRVSGRNADFLEIVMCRRVVIERGEHLACYGRTNLEQRARGAMAAGDGQAQRRCSPVPASL